VLAEMVEPSLLDLPEALERAVAVVAIAPEHQARLVVQAAQDNFPVAVAAVAAASSMAQAMSVVPVAQVVLAK
jgi:hypothetical protein